MKYMFRWQLSTPILALVPILLELVGICNYWSIAVIANVIGSLIFFKIDEKIFKPKKKSE
jgi:hypothetical protein